jgi:hypothetical protein
MTFRLVSDEGGEFGFDAIAGDYLFRISKAGFHTTYAPQTVPLTLPPGWSYLSEWITLVEERSGA